MLGGISVVYLGLSVPALAVRAKQKLINGIAAIVYHFIVTSLFIQLCNDQKRYKRFPVENLVNCLWKVSCCRPFEGIASRSFFHDTVDYFCNLVHAQNNRS